MVVLGLFLLGLCMGSFIGATAWRLHEQAKSKKKRTELSILRGRSMCEHCHHTLAVKDLIPLFSWLSLGGKCRYCGKSIGLQALMLEVFTGLLFVASYQYWPGLLHGLQWLYFGLWLVILVGLIALAIYDLRWFLLPDRLVFPLVLVASVYAVVRIFDQGWMGVTAALWGLVIASGIFYLLFQLSRGSWIGGGDVKLGLVLGLILGGPSLSLLMLFIASLLGAFVSLPLMMAGKANRKTMLPFGPFLIAATVITQLFGASLITWYKHRFLLY